MRVWATHRSHDYWVLAQNMPFPGNRTGFRVFSRTGNFVLGFGEPWPGIVRETSSQALELRLAVRDPADRRNDHGREGWGVCFCLFSSGLALV